MAHSEVSPSDAEHIYKTLATAGYSWEDFRAYQQKTPPGDWHGSISTRVLWLASMFVIQSFSSNIIDSYSLFLHENFIVATLLTTLIGTAGNAGSQATGLCLSAVATGQLPLNRGIIVGTVLKEVSAAVIIAGILSGLLVGRMLLFGAEMEIVFALAVSLFAIVFVAIVMGTSLPLLLASMGLNPSGGATPILTTALDVGGVYLSVIICSSLLEGSP